ncbi:putative DCC family thiol-disulfide oxidoreductase YuxK [Pararhizobium capsulatum DSM 1112]|uniref:DCC family thiol-disulfide oxidoreductase YuxK n=1 Tax=Pararhizobium capsulatum DSM 1112 TaxID=1121113 RepID=A0ABU0BMK4_9HYPH|nr:DCC1-like thiol-disulfide oxidoreductase family protein [Pararhizobium capsulatum]MDQ0319481.1 putative DCC family thiol-disulfide oxidoreductase YuxK [Pararhizobium capsulatum DSM 1112]
MSKTGLAHGRMAYSYRDDSSVPAFDDTAPIIVFDGTCVFCSAWARFVLHHDRECRFRMLTAQSLLGTALYRHYGLDERDYETNLVITDGQIAMKSEAALAVLEKLGMPWALAGVLRIIPKRMRDWVYGHVARNRYRIAGRKAECMVPTAEQRSRFIG